LTSHGRIGRGEHVVEVAVEARLEDRRRVVGVGGLDHGHRDEAGHDVDLVVDAVDLLDAAAERQTEDEDEEERAEDRGDDGLRPQLEHAVRLARAQGDEPAVAGGQRDHDAIALTYTSASESAPTCRAVRPALSRASRRPPRMSAISSHSSSASSR
jgi:hypothetical protein